MTGICYFADDGVKYFAEQQVSAIKENIDDDVALLRESDKFSPELVDSMIEEASKSGCKDLVLMVEEKNYNLYSQAVPRIYGDMFESIEVIPENFIRIIENDLSGGAAATTGAGTVTSAQIRDAKTALQNQNNNTEDPNKKEQQSQQPVNEIFFCDASVPLAKAINAFVNAGYKAKGILTFMTVPNAYLFGASIPGILNAFPKSTAPMDSVAKNFNNDLAPEFVPGADAESVAQAFIQKLKPVQGGQQKLVHLPKTINQDYINKLNSAQCNNGLIKFSNELETYANSKNGDIFKMIGLLKDTKKPLELDNKREEKFNKDDFGEKNNVIKENHKYIITLMSAMEFFEKNGKDGKVKDRKAISSATLEALKQQLAQWSGYNNAKKELTDNSAIAKFAFETAEKVKNGLKKDLAADKKEEPQKKKDPTERTIETIYCWKYYENLCNCLGIKPE